MAKKTKKKINKASQVGAQQMNKKSYFESGRLSRLTEDDVFLGTDEQNGYKYLYPVFTRKHINGHISFAVFGVAAEDGDIVEVLYDFNQSPEDFDDLKEHLSLELIDDRNAVVQLIYDMVLTTRIAGIKMPADFSIASRILPFDVETWHQCAGKKLASFQKQPAVYDSSDEEARINDHEAAVDYAAYNTTIYNPKEVSHWGKPEWDQFLLDMDDFEREDYFEKGFTPIGFLFEQVMLEDYPVTGTIKRACDHLSTALPPLSTARIPESYQSSDYEILMENALWMSIRQIAASSDDPKTLRILEELIDQYPNNPEFRNQLQDFYKITDQQEALFGTVLDNYSRFPLQDFAFVGYFTTIIAQQRQGLIDAFFAKGYLIEDHYPKDFVFFDRHFQFYYLMLGQYLASIEEYGSVWTLYQRLSNTDLFKRSELFQKCWQDLLFKPIALMATKLVTGSKEEKDGIIKKALNNK